MHISLVTIITAPKSIADIKGSWAYASNKAAIQKLSRLDDVLVLSHRDPVLASTSSNSLLD